QVKIKPVAIGQKAAHVEQAAAGLGGELLDLHAVLGKHHGSIDAAQAVGKIDKRNRRLGQLQPAAELRMRRVAADVHRECGRTVADQVGVEDLHQLQVKAALGPQIESMIAGQ